MKTLVKTFMDYDGIASNSDQENRSDARYDAIILGSRAKAKESRIWLADQLAERRAELKRAKSRKYEDPKYIERLAHIIEQIEYSLKSHAKQR